LAAPVILAIVGFCCVEENPFGPLHAYDTPPLASRFRVVPVQTGLLLDALADIVPFTVTLIVVDAEQPAALVTVTV
jgi:hypothetical protein